MFSLMQNLKRLYWYTLAVKKHGEEVQNFYGDFRKATKLTKTRDILLVMSDFIATIGKGVTGNIVGRYGLGERKERGNRLVSFSEEEHLVIADTMFKQPKRKLYTWKNPGDVIRNRMDI